jgi:putative aldouronate transport system substrate-binding protein
MNNGIEGVNFALEDGLAATIKPETPEGKVVNTDIKSFAQLEPTSLAITSTPSSRPLSMSRRSSMTAFPSWRRTSRAPSTTPAAAFVSPTYVAKGAQLDNIVADARIKYLAGQLDEQGLKDAIKLWNTSGGDKVKEEINKLWQENKK